MSKTLRISLLVFGLLLTGALAGFVIWAKMPAGPMPEALSALQINPDVAVSSGEWLVFSPANTTQPSTGLIIYPGGRVDYRAYAPTAHQIAAQGYLVVIARMPLNLAVFNPNVADRIKPLSQMSSIGQFVGIPWAAQWQPITRQTTQGC